MKVKKYQGDFFLCKVQAVGFWKTACWCIRDRILMPKDMRVPFVTNIAFACECFMKAIMIWESDNHAFFVGHNLQELFDRLQPETQQQITDAYEKKSVNSLYNSRLSTFLEMSKNDFGEWRYSFQDRDYNLVANASDYLNFVDCLKAYVFSLEAKAGG